MHFLTKLLYQLGILYLILMKFIKFLRSKIIYNNQFSFSILVNLVKKKDRLKIAFLIKSKQYQFKVMLFELNNTLIIFQKLINKILRQYIRKFV